MTDLMNTAQVARYLGINEKKVYSLAKNGKIPCTRVTGKWTFPKKLIDQWIEQSAAALVGKRGKAEESFVSRGDNSGIPGWTDLASATSGRAVFARFPEVKPNEPAWCAHLF